MTPLAKILRSEIATTGPMTLAQYMTACLLHPQYGYYTSQRALGAEGDFTTAPEISQMFGELIGLCLAQTWMDQGAPKAFALVELGPGRGTLMADILRATARVSGFHSAAQVHLIEASHGMRDAQNDVLAGYAPQWHDTIETIPNDLPIYAVANEFFDALPVRQFQRDPKGWSEVMVGLSRNDAFQLGLSQPAPVSFLDSRLEDTQEGDIVEVCTQGTHVADTLATRIAAQGGMALIIDYGGWRSIGDTFQAVKQHQPTDPFAEPGRADLTCHVDFEALANAARSAGCAHSQLTPQGVFLETLGITERAQALAARLRGAALESHIAAHRRLTHPDEMGTLFKVLGLFPASESPPPGLEA